MSSSAGLEALPVEIIEQVVLLLDESDVVQLRLVSRELASKTSQGVFKSLFSKGTVFWTSDDSLQDFVHLSAANGILSERLEYLALIGRARHLYNATEHDIDHIQLQAKVLAQSLVYLRSQGRLTSLSLAVHDTRPRDPVRPFAKSAQISYPVNWRSVWQCAAETFDCAAAALAETRYLIQELDLFGTAMAECALPIDRIGPVIDRHDLSNALQKLTCLSLRLSDGIESGHPSGEGISENLEKEPDRSALRRFLSLCPALESMHLHWYNVTRRFRDLTPEQQETQHILSQLATLPQPSLRHITLSGIHCTEATLLSFTSIRSTHLLTLRLDDIHLTSGRFRAFFDLLTTQAPLLTEFEFDNLFERLLVCFDIPGEPHMPTLDPTNGPNSLHRKGAAVRQKIGYYEMRGSMMDSMQNIRWSSARMEKFGPPKAVFTASY